MKESKVLLEKTLNNLSEVVLVADRDRRVIMTNKTLEKVFGYKPEDLIGKSTQLLHQSPESFAKLAESGKSELEKNGIFQTGYTMKRNDGTLFDCEIITTAIVENDGWQSGIKV